MGNRSRTFVLVCLMGAAGGMGCAASHEYVPVESLASPPKAEVVDYLLQPGDVITIRVWNQDSITTKTKVRPDGKVSLPFANDVKAAGATPTALAQRIQTALKDFIVNPVVTVTLDEPRPVLVAVLGEVVKPGNYPIDANAGVLQALAMASGMTPFANRDQIIVIRQKPDGTGVLRILFRYSALTREEGRAASFRLQAGDVVVVE